MPAGSEPESQQDILAADLAALTDADVPPGEGDWAPDPGTGRPAELAGLTAGELAELIAAAPVPVAGPLPAGCLPRDGTGFGAGFADGGELDVLAPGVTLAGFAAEAHARLGTLPDDELIGVLRAWWRQTSWAQARALAAIAELARRRPADRTPAAAPGQFPARLSEFLPDEVAMALTLTQCAAQTQVALALDLAARPATAAALEGGRIDLRKARVILDAITPLSAEHAAAAEAAVLPAAAGQTTGELRTAVTAAVLALDPAAVRRRREEAEKAARVESWTGPDGTATLTGRSLPPAEVLAADKRLCQVAAYWKKLIRAAWKHADPHGQQPHPEHGMDLLRARAYLALLLGQPVDVPPAGLLPPAQPAPGPESPDGSRLDGSRGGSTGPGPGPDGATASHDQDTRPDGSRGGSAGPGSGPADSARDTGPDSPAGRKDQHLPAGLRHPGPVAGARGSDPVAALPPLAGLISLTLPLTTLLGGTDRPGEAAGYGPLHADTARLLACALAGHRATRWQIILTSPDGRALAAGTARGSPAAAPAPGGSGGGGGGRSRSPPSPSPPAGATTATPNPATTPAPPCSGWSAPAPPPAPGPAAAAPPPAATWTTRWPTTTVASPVNAESDPAAGDATAANKPCSGPSNSPAQAS